MNTKIEHTPGPWLKSESFDGSRILFAHPGSALTPIADVWIGSVGREEAELNAALIEGAPGLLHACKYILSQLAPEGFKGQTKLYSDSLHPHDDDKTVVDFLREAVAKAEGFRFLASSRDL